MKVRTYRRKVLCRCGARARANEVAIYLSEKNPRREYIVEYTPVCNQREQWRVIMLSAVVDGTPDVHPLCEKIIREQLDTFYENLG